MLERAAASAPRMSDQFLYQRPKASASDDSNLRQRVLKLMQSESDESKLAGLMMVPQVVSSDSEEEMLQIFRAVRFAFLVRLLSSPGSPGDSADPSSLYKVLALNILSAFCAHPAVHQEIFREPAFDSVADKLVDALGDQNLRPSLNDTLVIINALAQCPSGLAAFNQAHAPRRIAEVLCDEGAANESAAALLQTFDSLSDPTLHAVAAAEAVPPLARVFMRSQSTVKFDAFSRLTALLTCTHPPFHAALLALNSNSTEWQSHVVDGLLEVLRSRLPREYKRDAFLCALCMFDLLGPQWALRPSVNAQVCEDSPPACVPTCDLSAKHACYMCVCINALTPLRSGGGAGDGPQVRAAARLVVQVRLRGRAYSPLPWFTAPPCARHKAFL